MGRILLFLLAILLSPLAAAAQPIAILALGDSLTAGLGLPDNESFPSQLQDALRLRGHDVRIINAGVSGDTMESGRDRLDWALGEPVDAVIVELGANDALRGLPPDQTRQALAGILETLKQRQIPVLVAGMLAPRNLGPEFAARFDPMFGELAESYGAVFYPFFLDGVAADPSLNQADGIHPNASGVRIIVEKILPSVEELIGRIPRK
jgi:acyl-CoA thioesterase-1